MSVDPNRSGTARTLAVLISPRRLAPLALAAALVACGGTHRVAAGPAAPPGFAWVHTELAEHPLVARIVRVSDGAFVTEAELAREVIGADVSVLGERHDNQDHHRLQARLVAAIATQKKDVAVAMEMFDESSQSEVDAGLAAVRAKRRRVGDDDESPSEAFAKAAKWDKVGWGPVAGYAPLLDAIFGSDLQIVAANLDNGRARGLAHHGESALDQETLAKLGLDEPVDPKVEREIETDLMEAHCNHLPSALLPKMALAQRGRDAAMAAHVANRPSVLITGAGHARTDRGVPAVLKKQNPALKVVSVAMLEVVPNKFAPSDYPQTYDYLWFTTRRSLEDDCAAMDNKRPRGRSEAQGREKR